MLMAVGMAIGNIFYSTHTSSRTTSLDIDMKIDIDVDIDSQTEPQSEIHSESRTETSTSMSTSLSTITSTSTSTYDYRAIYNWTIPSDNSDFRQIPYRQFCRFRNKYHNKSKSNNKVTFSPMEKWVSVPIPVPVPTLPLSNNKILLHVQFHCYQLLRESAFGTGNWVQMMYLLRHSVLGTISSKLQFPVQMDVKLSCLDQPDLLLPEQYKMDKLVMPWLVGHFSSKNTLEIIQRRYNYRTQNKTTQNQKKNKYKYKNEEPNLNLNLDCHANGWGNTPVGGMAPFIQQDLRRMAVALIGLPHNDPTHPAHAWFRRQQQKGTGTSFGNTTYLYHLDDVFLDTPPSASGVSGTQTKISPALIPNIQLDDVVIHFRCGDIMASQHVHFRFIKFKEFANRIDNSTESIGIVTQSFGSIGVASRSTSTENHASPGSATGDEQARARDQDDEFRVSVCRSVVYRFVDYLQDKFPTARVSVYNGPDETVALAYARLTMAKKQAFAYPDSSFSVFPVLATFGVGYHMRPIGSPYNIHSTKNEWLLDVPQYYPGGDDSESNLQLMNISNGQALFAVETLHMRLRNETQAAIDIVNWFANDELKFPRIPNSAIIKRPQ